MPTKKVESLYNKIVKYLNSIAVSSDPDINDYESRKAIEMLDDLCERLMKGEKLKWKKL